MTRGEKMVVEPQETISMNDPTPPPRTGRRRSPATRKAILRAALSMLRREPYAAISIERIAAKAKASKHSIYRWWNSKGELILDAFIDYGLKRAVKIEPTDDTLADLENFMVQAFRSWQDPLFDKGFRGLIVEMSFDPGLRQRFNETYLTPRRVHVTSIVKNGIERGQIRPDTDPETVVAVMFGFLWLHLLFDAPDFDEQRATQKLMNLLRPLIKKG